MGILEKIFGNYSDKEIKRMTPIVDRTEALEPDMQRLTGCELKGMAAKFKERLAAGETLDDILPEAFAVVREATTRLTGKRHFRVQLMGGIVLHQGRIAEMRTGEGKTQTAAPPLYLNALSGKGVHLVTVNEYLASYHAGLMGQIFGFLGMTTGCILHGQDPQERRAQYNCDITYSTNNELGFDYLRDNMVVVDENRVQRELHYAIIDEVDSILIDEARTPLIISGPGGKANRLYEQADNFAKNRKKGRILNEDEALNNPMFRQELQEEGDFVVDEKRKTVTLTQQGVEEAERYFGVENLSDPDNIEIQHFINNALKANYGMQRDVDYVVKDDEIIIVDEFTGRLMPGRRYSDGLHQAIEAKEKVKVQRENRTLATITFQNFFNKYTKKAGMTGTALTEDGEFREIYKMDVVAIPTNRPMIRNDRPDVVYRTEAAKYRAIVQSIEEAHQRRQPVLVGTVSIEKSELVSNLLKRKGIKHEVLNAKHHEREADIIALAGQAGNITIATNMAGRGTDIMLGEGVREIGGLKVIGTERHEARRIDNQLRGRAGRQGDPGESQFFLSMEDELMRLFGGDRLARVVDAVGMGEDDVIEHKMLSRGIENAQKKVEGNNFGSRKHVLQYDRVMNEQREIIYAERNKIIDGEDLTEHIGHIIKAVLGRAVDEFCVGDLPEEWEITELNKKLLPVFHKPTVDVSGEIETITQDKLKDRLYEQAMKRYAEIEKAMTEMGKDMRDAERVALMNAVNNRWATHIDEMDQMRDSVGLRSYAQRDPLVEYKFQGFEMFEEMNNNIQQDTVWTLFNIDVLTNRQMRIKQLIKMEDLKAVGGEAAGKKTVRKGEKIGANEVCPKCNSGRKYKKCCGRSVG